VVALSQSAEINNIFSSVSTAKNSHLSFVKYTREIQNIVQNSDSLSFEYTDLNQITHPLTLSLIGKYQAGNTSLALRAMEYAALRDGWTIDWKVVEKSLRQIRFPGRFEVIKTSKDKISVIDGAHNPQKMEAFLSSLSSIYPDTKFTLVIAIKNGKDSGGVLETISRHSSNINKMLLTTFSEISGLSLTSIPTNEMKDDLVRFGFKGEVVETKDLQQVFEMIETTKTNYIFTGSLYILGTIRSEFGLV
jgi:dihydrofolate synthase / folylpolyglutamate synthase